MTTEEKNKLIDLFMESKGKWISQKDVRGGEVWGDYKPHNYHSSWDLLMPVVEKIESLGYWVEILGGAHNVCGIGLTNDEENFIWSDTKTKIEAVYNACVEFILWYNTKLY